MHKTKPMNTISESIEQKIVRDELKPIVSELKSYHYRHQQNPNKTNNNKLV